MCVNTELLFQFFQKRWMGMFLSESERRKSYEKLIRSVKKKILHKAIFNIYNLL